MDAIKDYLTQIEHIPIGYIEAKDIGKPLDDVEKSEQINRYFSLDNLLLTIILSSDGTSAVIDRERGIVTALGETIRLMAEVDKAINSHGGWLIA